MFLRSLDFKEKTLTSRYRQFKFPLRDFLNYTHAGRSIHHYQMIQVKEFFNTLKKNIIIESFTDQSYRMLVTIPEAKVYKSQKRNNSWLAEIWIAKVWIAEELFYYVHPFLFPTFSSGVSRKTKEKITKDEFEVQFKVIQVFSSVNLEKKFFIKEFLDSYSAVLSNQRRTKIKKLFLQFVDLLKEHDLIESNLKIISDGLFVEID